MKIVKKILIGIGALVAFCILCFGAFLLLAQLLEYRPEAVTPLENLGRQERGAQGASPYGLSLLTWNIGYCGLDAAADFVMEGGRMGIAAGRSTVEENLRTMVDFTKQSVADILLLQEVDRPSRRSYRVDEVAAWLDAYPDFGAWYGVNFKAFFVPYPLPEAIGSVHSGILTLSRLPVQSAARYQLPGLYNWPVGLVNLKRCLLVTRLPSAAAGKDWVVINLHLDAYDATGVLRKEQLAFLKSFVIPLYEAGHFIVIGGDWNNLFPGIDKERFAPYSTPEQYLFWVHAIPADWTPAGWQWVFDGDVPTSRSLEQAYRPGENFTTVIDGFLVSPNVEVVGIEGSGLGFRYSDHNPIRLQVRIGN